MQTFSLDNKPGGLVKMSKATTVQVIKLTEPFVVETGEGSMAISPETTDDWDEGYFLAYPSDGSKPYAISPKFIEQNYSLA